VSTTRLGIVHVIARLNVGGAARNVLELAAEQRRRGHEAVVVAGIIAPGEESMEYLAGELGVPYHWLPSLRRELSLRYDPAAVRQIRQVLLHRRPDVLHTHTSKAGATGRLAAALIRRRHRPRAIVHTFHGHVLRGYFDPVSERVFRLVERGFALGTTSIVAVSEEVRDDLVAMGVAPADRFVVIPYGFDLDGLAPNEEARRALRGRLQLDEATFVVGWAGRLTAIKRPLDLVRTLHALVTGGANAALLVVGDGEDRPAVEALARELGVTERCRFVGYQRGMREWYSAFDALLLTSENEGTPVVAIEALAAGRPVVATRAGGTSAVVREGETGFLTPIGATDELAARLARLAADPGLAGTMGQQGARDVRRRFSRERMTDDVEALYRRALTR
jgi:glycosyltransferase involved in cell wall biosynthesis